MKREYSDGEGAIITLQTLIEITKRTALPGPSRRNRLSHLRTFARIAGKPPSAILATVEELRSAMAAANPGVAGISKEYWVMVKSSVWWALEKTGVTVIRATGTVLPDEWALMVEPLPWRPHRLTLAPLLKFCTDHGLSPTQFDQAAADQFRDWMQCGYRKRTWQKPYRRAVEMFARCGREFPDAWPQVALRVRFVDDHYTFKWSALPELEAATDCMLAHMAQPPSRRSTNKKAIRASTARARKYYILRAASAIALVKRVEPSTIRSLADVINPEGIELFVEFVVARRSGNDRTGDLSQACGAFNAIARHWLKLDAREIEQLVSIRRSVMPRQGPAEKNKRLMADFRSLRMRADFLAMPYRVIERLARKEYHTDLERQAGELAFTTAFLTGAPLRIGEYVALEKGINIIDRGARKERQVVVHIDGEVRKAGGPLTFVLPPRIVKLMDLHWKLFRRGKACETSLRLLPGWAHAGRNAHHLSQQLAKFTTCELGRRITAHQFRVLVGYIFLTRNPGCYEAVRRFLGHKSIRTTMTYYAFMLDDEAFEQLDKTIDDLLGD